MAGISHYINTAAVEPSRARTPSLVTTQPQPFPVLFFGDVRPHQFFFHNNGTIEDFSGDSDYTLRVTIGDPDAGPFGGNYTLTYGAATTPVLSFDSDAEDVQAALNGLSTVVAAGGVTVLGAFPTFLVYNNAVGVTTTITANSALLSPDSNIAVTVLTTGSASVRQQTQVALRRLAVTSDATWTVITSPDNGWSGLLTTNTEGAAALIAEYGEEVGGYLQAETLINVEVIDADGNIVAYYQQTVLLRAKNSDLGSTSSTPLTTFLTMAQFLALGVQNRPAITGLASNTVDATKLGGQTTAASALPVGVVVALNFTVTVNDGAGTHSGIATVLYQLVASTHATSAPLWIRPYDYDAGTNAVVWRFLGALIDTLPAAWNATTGKLHYIACGGAAGAVFLAPDQVGTSLPA